MSHQKFSQQIISMGLILLFLVGCSATEAPMSIPPTATQEPPTILGKLIGPEGAIGEAEVSLETYLDETCVNLAESSDLSESEKSQLDDCSGEFASVISDTEGRYRFSEVSPGWYKLIFAWDLSKQPASSLPFEFKGGFLIAYFQTNQTPASYHALAQGDIFYFSGMEDMVIDFDY